MMWVGGFSSNPSTVVRLFRGAFVHSRDTNPENIHVRSPMLILPGSPKLRPNATPDDIK